MRRSQKIENNARRQKAAIQTRLPEHHFFGAGPRGLRGPDVIADRSYDETIDGCHAYLVLQNMSQYRSKIDGMVDDASHALIFG